MSPRLRRDDRGATLVIVMFIVAIIGLVLGSVMSLADTSVRTTLAMRDQAGSDYNGDGAAQAAINVLRKGTFDNQTGSQCFSSGSGSTNALKLQNFYPATNGFNGTKQASAAVVCASESGTGAQSAPVPISDKNKPGNAILALGQNPSEDGIHIKALSSSNPFRVHGSIVSDSNINVTQGSMVTDAPVFAHSGCAGAITSVPPPTCTAGTVSDPNYLFEPAFATPTNAVPTYQPVPTACPNKIVTFNPGYYDDANALSSLMKGNGNCKGSVWWFRPGIYYFDFHNNPADPSFDPVVGSWSGGDTWTVNDGSLIAGTPVDAKGNPIALPLNPPQIPGACENPINSTSALGVQFIFGGDSQLVISGSANAEICGTYSASRPPIAIYGLKSGTDTTTNLNGASTLEPTAVTPGNFTNATATNLANNDGNYATWTNASGNKTGTVTVSGYSPINSIPAGSVLKSATLRVVHRDPTTATSVQATITPNGGSALSPVTLTIAKSAWTTDNQDVTSSLAQFVHDSGFSGASVSFQAKMNGSGSEDLDAIQLDMTYIAPAFRAETTSTIPGNCLASTYSGGSSGQCAMVSTPTSYAGAFYVQGTTYVPIAVVDLTLNNITSQVLRFGVVVRSLWVKETGSINYSGPVIELPDNSLGYGIANTIVDLSVYVCPGVSTPTCDTDASRHLTLTVRVQIDDPNGNTVAGARRITVLSWSQQR